MKKFLIFVLFIASLFICAPVTYAFSAIAPDKDSGDVTIESNENIDDNLATAGNNVYIRGNVNDNLFVAGNSVTIDGDVNGTLFVAGNTISISGKITGDAIIAGNMIDIKDTASFGRDLFIGGSIIDLNAPVARNLYIGASKLVLNSTIGGNIKANLEQINLGEKASVAGNFDYTSEKNLFPDENKITGSVNYTEIEQPKNQTDTKNYLFNWFMGLLKLLFAGILLVLITPKWLEKLAQIQKEQTAKSMGFGFLAILLIPMAIMILFVTLIGIPIAVIVSAVYLILIYLTKMFAGYYIGKLINPKLSPILTMVLGIFVIQVVFAIPFISVIAKLFIIILGLGAFYLSVVNKKEVKEIK